MAQAMEKSKVIELLEYYKDIDGEVSIYRKIITDLTDLQPHWRYTVRRSSKGKK